MKSQLAIATLAVGFLAGLGIAAVRGDFSQPAAAPVQGLSEQAAAVPLQAVAPEPAASDPESDGRDSADSLPAPTYDSETAARDRAAAHSSRSR